MSLATRLSAAIADNAKLAIAVMLLLTVAVGAGAPQVGSSSSLDQFQTESEASEKLDYIEANFSADGNTTTAQIIVRGDNVLERESLLETLRFQQSLRENATVNATLVEDDAVVSVAGAVATAAIRGEQARDLQQRATELNASRAELQAERAAIRNRTETLNATAERLRAALTTLRQNPTAEPAPAFERVRANTTVELNRTQFGIFQRATTQLRGATNESQVRAAYRLGTRGVLASEYAAVAERGEALQARGERLRAEAENLTQAQQELRDAPTPSLSAQLEQLESMNASAVEATVERALAADGGTGLLRFMPTDYDPGTASADATFVLVTQEAELDSSAPGAAGEAVTDAQLAMQDVAEDRDLEYLVFGSGIVAEEIETSQSDSLLIVGPLALLFVLVALTVAYRDLLDIVLGVAGIGAVLTWTFGFMGWVGIDFNQIFVAVPVLLIGLSIDYAIHIFMRHREERGNEDTPSDPRGAMRVALSGVGVALLWVTATTVIGFLSNLTSPVPPIQEFGVVSAVGITAALLVFGVLVPALKVELDELLEGFGLDRRKRAFGTGGGRFSSVLSVGATAARRAPYVVIVLVLLVSAVAAVGGSQVSTEFSQEDFLADEPPEWMAELPEPFAPSEYTVKSNLEFINDRFVREDSQAQILVEGSGGALTGDDALERLATAREAAAEKGVTQELPSGEPAIEGPLSVMRTVATNNESFRATFEAADTDGNGVPDRNVSAVYASLFEVAPDQAGRYVQRTGTDVQAVRLVVSVQGDAGGAAVTEQMQAVADDLDSNAIVATATGTAILNNIVQDQLLQTVVESLLITLVVVFLFLMVTYRVSDGSASLGAVTLLPVAFAVAWILGAMFLLGIAFNAVTGLITSLTIGLGVAYTIHLSERYTQELERADTVWEAMRTAVTGTGGALLGSAATTVGGFGVLSFAILPPLRQFGIIAGLSITFAFLGSVFILPSLLTVWTRFAGPQWAREQVSLRGVSDAGASEADEADTGGTVSVNVRFENGDGEHPTGRSLAYEYASPGEWVDARVGIGPAEGRVALRERLWTDAVEVTSVDPAPVERTVHDGTLYVAWELADEPASVEYSVRVPEDAPDETTYRLSGTALTGDGETPVPGPDAVTVVADLLARIDARGVSDDDLRVADDYLAAGAITGSEVDRIYRHWAGADGLAATNGEDAPEGDEETATEPDGEDRAPEAETDED